MVHMPELLMFESRCHTCSVVRIKQWRVRPDVSCPPRLPGFARACYGVLREGAEASEAFGPNAGGHGGLAGFSLARENVTKQDSVIDGFFYTFAIAALALALALTARPSRRRPRTRARPRRSRRTGSTAGSTRRRAA